jgi:hypothetical protein
MAIRVFFNYVLIMFLLTARIYSYLILSFLEEMKLEKMLNFHDIIQSWTRVEEKDIEIESTKKEKDLVVQFVWFN